MQRRYSRTQLRGRSVRHARSPTQGVRIDPVRPLLCRKCLDQHSHMRRPCLISTRRYPRTTQPRSALSQAVEMRRTWRSFLQDEPYPYRWPARTPSPTRSTSLEKQSPNTFATPASVVERPHPRNAKRLRRRRMNEWLFLQTSTSSDFYSNDLYFALRILRLDDRCFNASVVVSFQCDLRQVEIAIVILQLVHQVAATSRMVVVAAVKKVGRL